MSEPVPSIPTPAPAEPATAGSATPRRYGLKYYIRRTVIYLLTGYVLLVLGLFIFQRKLIYHGEHTAPLDPAHSGFVEQQARAFEAHAEDGVTVRGWQILPGHFAPPFKGPAPDFDKEIADGRIVDLFFHGNAGNRSFRTDLYILLAKQNCHSVSIDYRGFGDSDGEPSEEGLAEDARAAWNWITSKGVKPDCIVIHGESLGCAVAVRLAREMEDAGTPPAGLILEAPFSSLPDVAGSIYWFIPVRLILRERYPSLERISKLTSPLLIFHGKLDEVVPFWQGQKLFDAAPEKARDGTPKQFVEFPMGHHNNVRNVDPKTYDKVLSEFLAARAATAAQETAAK